MADAPVASAFDSEKRRLDGKQYVAFAIRDFASLPICCTDTFAFWSQCHMLPSMSQNLFCATHKWAEMVGMVEMELAAVLHVDAAVDGS